MISKSIKQKFAALPPLAIVAMVIGSIILGYYVFEQVSKNIARKDAEAHQSESVVALTQATFDQTIGAGGVVLVEFGAPWCPACRAQAPIVQQLAETHGSTAVIAKVDVDQYAEIANRFQIQGIPAIIIFKNGVPARKFVGLTRKEVLVNALSEVM